MNEMPKLGLGTWKSEPGEVVDAVKTALRLGYRHIDCAAIYGNEAEIGQALAESFADGVVAREDVWITSKLWNDHHAREHVRAGIEKTLSDLRLDYLDLYLVHWPVALRHGVMIPEKAEDLVPLDEMPLLETWRGMEALNEAGLARAIGVSNFSVKKLEALLAEAAIPPSANQVELQPYLQQPALKEFCDARGIELTAYSPLGSRDRPDEFKAPDELDLFQDPTITAIAERLGATPAQVLIRWAIARGTSVIPKSVNPGRMQQNLDATRLELSDDDMAAIAALDKHRRYITGSFWTQFGGAYTLENLWDE